MWRNYGTRSTSGRINGKENIMKITFNQSIDLSAHEFSLLRQRAEDKRAFDQACEQMRKERYTADTKTGITKNRSGVVGQFVSYDWAVDYEANPHFVFFDFFRGHLLNKYSRIIRGV